MAVAMMDDGGDATRRGVGWLVGAVFSLVLFVAAVGASYVLGVRESSRGEPPLIRADGEPMKIAPEDPGGTVYPHQKIGVYRMLTGEGESGPERILPPPVEPVLDRATLQPPEAPANTEAAPEPAAPAGVDLATVLEPAPSGPAVSTPAPVAQAPATGDSISALISSGGTDVAAAEVTPAVTMPATGAAPQQEATPPQAEQAAAAVAPVTRTEPVTRPVTAPAPVVAAPAPVVVQPPPQAVLPPAPLPVEEAAVPALPPAGELVQLGAYRQRDEAESAWRAISRNHAEVVGNLKPAIIRADLGDRGIYYRLRAGPFENKASAAGVCKLLKGRNQPCIVAQ